MNPGGPNRKGGIKRKYFHSPESDEIIRQAYHLYRMFGNRMRLVDIRKELGWPKYAIAQRARVLGLARTKELPWTEAEEQILEQWSHLALARIAMKFRSLGYQRSETAINLKIKRLHIREKAGANGYTALQIAEALGIDGHKVTRWIKRGLLRAERRGTHRTELQGGDHWLIERAEMRRFLLHSPDEWELEGAEKYWLIDILSKGELCAEFRKEVVSQAPPVVKPASRVKFSNTRMPWPEDHSRVEFADITRRRI